ncbi:MAG: hypothetical protein ACTSUZ_04675 [Candidatus Thorarchaeota archaeon]
MPDYSDMMGKAREDIHCATEVWVEALQEILGPRLESIYSKGSANKSWDSHIDYVPIISDVDIHITLNDSKPLFGNYSDDFDKAVKVSQWCEEEFCRRRPDHLHIPRMQVIDTHALKEGGTYTPPRPQDIKVLFGEPPLPKRLPSPETIRKGDMERIIEEREYIFESSRRIFDRSGLDLWVVIRVMTWKVSPSPVRLLTQDHPDPIDVWSWNRTKILGALKHEWFEKLARHYHGFYDAGWRLFLSGFKDLAAFRETAVNGYYVLWETLWIAEKMIGDVNVPLF